MHWIPVSFFWGGRGSFSCIVSEARCYFYILLSSFIQDSLSFKDDVRVLSNIRTMWDHIVTVKTCIYQLLQSDLVWTLQVSSLGLFLCPPGESKGHGLNKLVQRKQYKFIFTLHYDKLPFVYVIACLHPRKLT